MNPDRCPVLLAGGVISPEIRGSQVPVTGEMASPKSPRSLMISAPAEIQEKRRHKKAKIPTAKVNALEFKVKKVRAPITYNPMDVQDPLSTDVRTEAPALQESLAVFVEENRKRTRERVGFFD